MGEKRNTSGTPRPWKFIGVFFLVFFLIAIFLYAIDFVPEPVGGSAQQGIAEATAAPVEAHVDTSGLEETPVRIEAPAVGINTIVGNPTSTNAETLDGALLQGAVRYPDSGLLGENARMYIFGHQSYLPVVHNQAFKAFNGLQNLKLGDEVIVYSATAMYTYRVSSVTHTTADAGEVALGSGDRTLTLSTCDSFGTKSDRYVVTAAFVSRTVLPGNS
jgi:LPXTG-site transpeptidase (sortase) family protein